EEESTNFYHPGFGIKVALRNYAPVPHLLPILRHLRGNLFSFYRGKVLLFTLTILIIGCFSFFNAEITVFSLIMSIFAMK
ncbi:MAG: hypothetical protein IJM58_06565, partial [Muribaculaceae bacterium]|nr:hypothetical protein [Muribaculaceae bacterium]